MAVIRYTLLLIVLTLTTFLISPSKAETCTYNDLGDRTCTTSTAGTTTGNILENSTFGTGTTTSTSGWSTDGDEGIHTHGVGSYGQKYNGYIDQGGTLAFEGHADDNVYQDVDLVGDGHLTQSQINEGFTSTMSADVWFWNNVENTTTLKQTITAADGTVTTQTRNINDHDPNRTWNTGAYVNYTDSYTHNSNTQTDFTIRAEVYNETAGTNYDSAHYGPDVDNVQLSITTSGAQTTSTSTSSVTTLCHDRVPNTCTYDQEALSEAVDLKTDDGKDLFKSVDNEIETSLSKLEVTEVSVIVEDDFGLKEELTVEEFVTDSFTSFLEENKLTETFETALVDEGITEEEFFEELSNEMEEEFGMTEDFKGDNTNDLAENTSPDEEVSEEKMTEETTETEPTATVEKESTNDEATNEKVEETPNETNQTGEDSESVSEESDMDKDSETEGTETETSDDEAMEDEQTGDVKKSDADVKDANITVKVKRIIDKLEKTLKSVDDKVKAIQFITLKGIQTGGADLTSYQIIELKDTVKLNGIPDPDFFIQLNILQEQIYKEVSLDKYVEGDPLSSWQNELQSIDNDRERLLYEIQQLKAKEEG